MKNKPEKDISQLVSNFQNFIKNKPTVDRMYEEIRMMKFKIRPVQGDVLSVNLHNEKFIEVLWSLGKLDEFFQREYPKLSNPKKEIFVKIFDDIYHRYQDELNKVNLLKSKSFRESQVLEMEIFKENNKKIN